MQRLHFVVQDNEFDLVAMSNLILDDQIHDAELVVVGIAMVVEFVVDDQGELVSLIFANITMFMPAGC